MSAKEIMLSELENYKRCGFQVKHLDINSPIEEIQFEYTLCRKKFDEMIFNKVGYTFSFK